MLVSWCYCYYSTDKVKTLSKKWHFIFEPLVINFYLDLLLYPDGQLVIHIKNMSAGWLKSKIRKKKERHE